MEMTELLEVLAAIDAAILGTPMTDGRFCSIHPRLFGQLRLIVSRDIECYDIEEEL